MYKGDLKMTEAENTDLLSSWILSLSERPEAYKRFEGMIKFNLENNILDDEVFDLKRLSEKLGVDVTYVQVREGIITLKYSIFMPITKDTALSELLQTSID